MRDFVKPPYLGVAYYPEDWDESFMQQDIAMMKEAGINVARIAEFAWSRMEKEEGCFDFEWLHKVIDALADAGIATVLGTPSATPPVWLGRKFPSVFREFESGMIRNHGGRRHCCSNNKEYVKYSLRIAEKMAKEFGGNKNVIGWQIDNEIYYRDSGCFCQNCQDRFKVWLKNKFGTIEELNARWNLGIFSQEYSDFEEIPAPRNAWVNPHHIQEWQTFQQNSHVEFVTKQAEILKKYVDVPIGTDIMPFNGMNYNDMFKKMDVVQFNHYNTAENLWQVGLWFDFIRNIKDRPFWNTETSTCWGGSNCVAEKLKPNGFCYVNSWLPIAMGGEANMYWLWRTHWGGHEIMHGSVISASGRPMHTFGEVQKVSEDFVKAAEFLKATKVKTPLAMHFTSLSWNMFIAQQPFAGFDYYTELQECFYRPLIDSCCRPDILEAEHSLEGYKILFTPFVPSLMDNDMGKKIAEWVKDGGVWVVGPSTDIRNNDGARFKDRPFGMLEELTGVRWCFSLPDGAEGTECASVTGDTFEGRSWFELFEADGDELACVSKAAHNAADGKAVFLKKKVGKGTVFVLGTLPSYETMKSFIIPKALSEAGVEFGSGLGGSFMVVDRVGEEMSGKIILEHAGKGGEYTLPYSAKDILTGDVLSGKIEIAPYQVLVLEKLK